MEGLRVIRPRHLILQPRRPRQTLADIEGPVDKSLGTKESLAVRLRKLSVDGEKTLQGVAELAYQRSFEV